MKKEEEAKDCNLLFIPLTNFLHSFFCIVEYTLNHQLEIKSDEHYAHEVYVSNKLKRLISEKLELSNAKSVTIKNLLMSFGTHPSLNNFKKKGVAHCKRWFLVQR